jgi:hypothetical protein
LTTDDELKESDRGKATDEKFDYFEEDTSNRDKLRSKKEPESCLNMTKIF